MPKFPTDAPKKKVIKALHLLGFEIVREQQHIAMRRVNLDGSVTPLTMPNHRVVEGSTLKVICTQAGISRADFLNAYDNA